MFLYLQKYNTYITWQKNFLKNTAYGLMPYAVFLFLPKEFAQGMFHACYGYEFDFVLLGVDCLHVCLG